MFSTTIVRSTFILHSHLLQFKGSLFVDVRLFISSFVELNLCVCTLDLLFPCVFLNPSFSLIYSF